MKNKSKNFSLSYPKIVAIGFALLILIGSGLLMLPISTNLDSVSYIDALFTATSATCITGLVPFDTYTSWSLFGKIVIIVLIQIGGLGFITVLSLIVRMTKKKFSLRYKMLLKESVGSLTLGDVNELFKSVIIFTLCCEGVGALLLMIRFIPMTNVPTGILMSIFTSISAYCNAGFDLMGMFAPSSSLITVNGDPIIIMTISFLVVFGGLGFIVWDNMKEVKFNPKKFAPYSKLVLITTGILLGVGTVLFFIFEYNATLADMPFGKKLLNAFFCSVTPRTAGFNSVDIAAMTPASKMLTIVLMFIGGSSGSTAGGVKTVTIAVLVLCLIANMRNEDDIEMFGHRISSSVVKRSISVTMINFIEIFVATIIITLVQGNLSLLDIIFECTSAIGTVGMTAGITSSLDFIPRIVIIVLMYIGRLTSLIFALSFVGNKTKTTTQKPKCPVMVG